MVDFQGIAGCIPFLFATCFTCATGVQTWPKISQTRVRLRKTAEKCLILNIVHVNRECWFQCIYLEPSYIVVSHKHDYRTDMT